MRCWIRLTATVFVLGLVLLVADPAGAATLLHTRARPVRVRILPIAVVRALVDKYAKKYGIPLYIAHNLVEVESRWRQTAVSRKGARGVMQLRPRTARGLRVNIHDTEQNIEGGMRYLRQQYDRFKRWDLALAAYHSGPGKVMKYRGVPPRSRWYVKRILRKPPAVAKATPEPAAQANAAAAARDAKPEPRSGVWRRLANATGDSHMVTVETMIAGQMVNRIDEIVLLDGGQMVRIRREFHLVNGVWTLVSEQTDIPAMDGGDS